MSDVKPFKIHVEDSVLADLKTRLNMARFPNELELPKGEEWSYGTPQRVVMELTEFWRTQFDWRKVETELNSSLPQFITLVDAGESHGVLDVHFVHKKSKNPHAIPLIFIHGWPGNFTEVSKVIELLTNPTDPKHPSFHVVAPSLPGHCFSEPSKYPGLGLKTTAVMFNQLMIKLGYPHYLAQGGDWGSYVIKALGLYHSANCRGIHSNMIVAHPPTLTSSPYKLLKLILGFTGLPGGYSKREVDNLKYAQASLQEQLAYLKMQGTKPQTVSYGLTDSPVALLAWIYEKLHSWTDSYPWTPEEVCTWITLYWVSTAGPVGATRYYRENLARGKKGESAEIERGYVNVPLAASLFPKEIFSLPDDFAELIGNVKYLKLHESGGHFAAWERPEFLVDDTRRFTEIVLQTDKELQQL